MIFVLFLVASFLAKEVSSVTIYEYCKDYVFCPTLDHSYCEPYFPWSKDPTLLYQCGVPSSSWGPPPCNSDQALVTVDLTETNCLESSYGGLLRVATADESYVIIDSSPDVYTYKSSDSHEQYCIPKSTTCLKISALNCGSFRVEYQDSVMEESFLNRPYYDEAEEFTMGNCDSDTFSVAPSTVPTICADSTLKIKTQRSNGRRAVGYCEDLGTTRADGIDRTEARCANVIGAQEACPVTCDTCSTCRDPPATVSFQEISPDGTWKPFRNCTWVAEDAESRCALVGNICRATCNAC